MNMHGKISYVEFPSKNLQATQDFFARAFGWTFEDFGCEYTAFSNQGIDGGFFRADLASTTDHGSALVVLYSENIEETLKDVEAAGGTIVKAIFPFPGGRRFHFTEPSGNEFAVWSDLFVE